jgi:predicted ATPase
VPDVIGYLRLCGLPTPARIERAAEDLRYYSIVFVAPPWPAIFTQDAERKQSFEEAEETWRVMVNVYEEFRYTLVHLPKVSAEERFGFMLEQIRNQGRLGTTDESCASD